MDSPKPNRLAFVPDALFQQRWNAFLPREQPKSGNFPHEITLRDGVIQRGNTMQCNLFEALSGSAAVLLFSGIDLLNPAFAGACDRSTTEAFQACTLEAQSEHNYAVGMCDNIKDRSEKQSCLTRAAKNQNSADTLCDRQRSARDKVCNALGQAPYDPQINPSDFFSKITNPLLPLTPGETRVYKSGNSTVTVTVTDQTIKLMGVTCLVVRDVNLING
ncbi:MAG: hypothetical protein ACJ8AS_12775, partial [Hyphomicrobiales bacterium]